jgi:molecular chaperone DnaK
VKCGHALASARAVGDTGITEVTAMALGIRAIKGTQRDAFVPIIPKGTPYPLREPMKERFQPTDEHKIVVPVYEGDEPIASRNTEVGVIEYQLPQDTSATTQVEVSINYDRNRQVTVTIAIPGTTFRRTETLALRHDIPRSAPPPRPIEEEGTGDWQDELNRVSDFTTRFLENYEQYMEPVQSAKVRRALDNAKRLLVYPDEGEGRRLIHTLEKEVFNAGLATQLFLADRATDGAPPEIAKKINHAAAVVRQSHERGDRALAAEQVRVLKAMVAQAIQDRVSVKEIADQEDYGGLLRALGE